MSNLLPAAEADSVSFDPHRDKEALAGVIWAGFIRGLVAQAGGAPVHCLDGGRA